MSSSDKSKLDNITAGAKNTTIKATAPIAASASTGEVTISHNNSGVSANTYGVTAGAEIAPTFGGTFAVPGFTVNASGHITAAGSHNIKIPATTATVNAAGLMSAGDKQIVTNAVTNTGTSIKGNFPIFDDTTGKLVKDSGYSPSSFAAASHGTHVTYGASASAVGTASSAGSAATVSRSDHVHSISLATGDSNGQVKIAGVNVSVKGLGSRAYDSTSYLPLAGGTMSGDVAFTATTYSSATIDSKGLSWSGGTDGAKIFYRQTANNAGSLVLQLTDDGEEFINFRHTQGGQVYLAPNTRQFYPDTNDSGSVGLSSHK